MYNLLAHSNTAIDRKFSSTTYRPKMKPTILIAILMLAATSASWSAAAATDRSYYVTELVSQQKFDVYNDGRNTYLESIPGLVVTGATADGERFIVNGVPQQIRGFMNGKPITIVRGIPPIPKPAAPDPATVKAEIKQLTEKLDALAAKVPGKPPLALVGATAPATSPTGMQGTAAHAAGQRPGGAPHRADISDVYTYKVTPSDENLRLLVDRWSKTVGWKAIWDVDRDVPIGTSGEKAGDWKTAVRWVLTSTKFGDVAVKPCFYNNSVVRVVRETVKCNPNE
jgi:Toxin co-regulated pilus biosynthesis protein Q